MSNWDDRKVADSICKAAEKWGFFQLVNHGVPIQVLENAEATIASLSCQLRRTKYLNEHSPEHSTSYHIQFGQCKQQ
ncbi:hypothetical protein C1H46_034068 [Malus baccata]|uniref:Non-haem dioxygenase N-terminal domain-containing protein n=1 Tax=Malus baccata TaxID=106549 RepID=A0A540L238_MALBA|nr:hypothetical protein C1H46_034068 [Malus baccata]